MAFADAGSLAGTALDTIGNPLSGDLGRDAIHLATITVSSEERLFPGQNVGLVGDKLVSATAAKMVGIVDPFLAGPVFPGQSFWLVIYPRTITSLRHVWEHPAFDKMAATEDQAGSVVKELSKAYLEDFAKRLFSYYGQREEGDPESYRNEFPEGEGEYGSRLKVLLDGIEDGGAFGTDIEYGDDVRPSEELYRHYEIYTGRPAPRRPEYFRCAC